MGNDAKNQKGGELHIIYKRLCQESTAISAMALALQKKVKLEVSL